MSDTEPHNAGPAPLTLDNWYEMNHHDWKDVVNEHNNLLAEVKRLREREEQWQTHWEFLRSNWLAHVTTACLSGTDVVKVMDTLRPRDEEAGEEE